MLRKILRALIVWVEGMVFFVLISACQTSPQPPDVDTAAVFKGGTVTRQEVKDAVDKLLGALGDKGDASKHFNTSKMYRQIIEKIALDQMIKLRISELKLDKRESFTHAMKHISEELNISKLHTRAHDQQIKVSAEEIRKRYEQEQTLYGQASLSEATEAIRSQLEAEKEAQYFEKYLDDLRKKAAVTRYDELLMAPEPNEAELRMHYEQNRSIYAKASFDEAKQGVKDKLIIDTTEKWFQENRYRTLVTIHGKRFTVGEFYDELAELAPSEKALYQNFDSMKLLLDKMIDRMLIVEDTYDQMLDSESKDERGHVSEELLRQVLHQEEVDDQIVISEDEITAFFDKNADSFNTPPRVKINYLRISAGQTDPERAQAEQKVKEAYKRLKPGFFNKGEPFEKIASEYSEDAETAQNGGSIDGWISESAEVIEELAGHGFHENILGLKEKDISRPFMFGGSFYIVQVRKREGPNPVVLADAREAIRGELEARKHQEMTLQMENSLLAQAELIIFDKTIDRMIESAGKEE